ncbi:hypothetical protein SESBI_36221 [Sesbania bispinosa]|nr:hypothetical protein SESBI_36221 [Sesbania bispinosa]
MTDIASSTSSMEKLNNDNYDTWSTRIKYYMLGQDLWGVVGGAETITPTEEGEKIDKNWKSYDSQRKGWRCCCYVSRNVVFDEASSWWSSQAVLLPDSKEIEEKVQEQLEEQLEIKEVTPTREETIVVDQEGERSPDKRKRHWQTGVHTRSLEEERPSQIEEIMEEVP